MFNIHTDAVIALEEEIEGYHERFNSIKELTIQGLDKCGVAVMSVVFILTNIRVVSGNMKLFLKENHKALRQCEDHLELFGSLNFYWNYLAYDLLDYLIKDLAKKHKFFQSVSGEMAVYKIDIQKFRKRTTLELFCKTEPPSMEDSPAGFVKMVARFNWPKKSTLDDVENFRIQYARCYDLPTCAMMLDSIGIGSIVVSWFVPTEMLQVMRKKRALSVMWEFHVIALEFHVPNDICIYQSPSIEVSQFL